MGRCTWRSPCCCCCCCVLAWNIAEIPPSSEGCCSLVKQVILVTKNVYNTSGTDVSHRFSNIYVSQHKQSQRDIWWLLCWGVVPPFLGNLPVSFPTCLQGAASTQRLQVLEGHLHSKALDLVFFGCFCCLSKWFLEMSLDLDSHSQRGHPLHSVAMEMDEHRLGSPPPFADDPMIYFPSFLLFFSLKLKPGRI